MKITIDDVIKAFEAGLPVNNLVEMLEKMDRPIWTCQYCGAPDSIDDYGRCRIVSCHKQNVLCR